MPAPMFMSAARSSAARQGRAADYIGADAPAPSVASSGPTIRPRWSQAPSADTAAVPAGVPVQRMFRRLFGGGSREETPSSSPPVSQPPVDTSPVPMSGRNQIPADELQEINRRHASILANQTKVLRDSYIAPHQRRAQSLLATSQAGDGSPMGGSDYSQAALDGVTQGVAESLLQGTAQYNAHTQAMMDRASSLSTNEEFDAFHKTYTGSGQ